MNVKIDTLYSVHRCTAIPLLQRIVYDILFDIDCIFAHQKPQFSNNYKIPIFIPLQSNIAFQFAGMFQFGSINLSFNQQ